MYEIRGNFFEMLVTMKWVRLFSSKALTTEFSW